MPALRKYGFLFSFVLLSLAFLPLNLYVLAYFAFIPLFFTPGSPKKRAFLYYLTGVFFFSSRLYWILFLQVEPRVKPFLAVGFALMVLYLALYFGAFGFLFGIIEKSRTPTGLKLLLLPSLWVLLEYIRNHGAMGFPWSPLWMSQLGDLRISQTASLLGPYYLSWLTLLVNWGIFLSIRYRRAAYALIPLLFVFVSEIYGVLTLRKPTEQAEKIRVALFQPNVLPREYYDPEEWRETEDAFRELNRELKDSVDLIVLSESALPGFYRFSKRAQELIGEIIDIHGAPVLLGTSDRERAGKEYLFYNSALLIDTSRRIASKYDKTHLVPFGEWLPYEDRLPFLRNIDLGQGNYTPGREISPLVVKKAKFGVLICFESIFPEISRAFCRRGAGFLVNITSDGWYGRTLGPVEHFHLARFRAIEEGRYLVRAAKTGISAVVDDRGRIVKSLGLFERGLLTAEIPLLQRETFYARYGHFFPQVIMLIVVILLFIMWVRKVRKNQEEVSR